MIVATDLDRTLIYSRDAMSAAGDPAGLAVVAVERYDGADASWMTAAAADRFAELHRHALVVPVTTRTPEQYRRIRLPGPPPTHAVAANGGILLVDGIVDREWGGTVARRLAGVAPLAEVWEHAARVCRPEWTTALRSADGLFCYAVLRELPDGVRAGLVAELASWAQRRGWRVSLQGRKLYWVPDPLTKSAAVAEVARRTDCDRVVAAGDSLLDADLLEAAGRGIAARDGELVSSGWRAAHVSVTVHGGVRGGAEIVDWFAAQAAA